MNGCILVCAHFFGTSGLVALNLALLLLLLLLPPFHDPPWMEAAV